MVLCPACRRHIFTKEPSCPFCGQGVESTVRGLPAVPKESSRAQRYAIGAAIAASVVTAACSSPTTVNSANDVVDTSASGGSSGGDTNASGGSSGGNTTTSDGSNNTMQVARDPNDPNEKAAKERRRQEAEQQRRKQEHEEQYRHQGGGPCLPNGQCPPYGCVFPDDACDVVRV